MKTTAGGSLRIAILDDEADVRVTIAAMLRHLGHDVAECESFPDLERALIRGVDVTVLDLRMPQVDGLEVIRRITTMNTQTSLILMSGVHERVRRGATRLAVEHGLNVVGALSKPFRFAELNALLRGVSPAARGPARAPQARPSKRELRDAIARDELLVHYQPQVELATRRVIGFEALVRWQHPTRGRVSPSAFIPLAERSGLIHELSDWVFRRAMQDLSWCAARRLPLRLSLNCSVRSLQDASFVARFVALARETGRDPSQLVLEVTESVLAGEEPLPLELLTRLAMRGFITSIDDFGTGYATLAQLDRMPFSELKIDRGFAARVLTDQHTRIIAENTVELAHRLGMRVVVEGIEDARLWSWARRTGSELGQGYFIARPMPRDALPEWIAAWSSGRAPDER